MKFLKLAACITSASLLIACGDDNDNNRSIPAINMEKAQLVINTNADIAYAAYTDSVKTAKNLKTALATFKASPTAENLTAAKTAWLVAREPYGQTEVYRFRNSPVDALDVEGDLNAWPLGEALIDYVNTGNDGDDFDNDQIGVTAHGFGNDLTAVIDVTNAEATNTIIGNTAIAIDNTLLAKGLAAEDEHDVISGYHAIEFLLWGQDLNTTDQSTTDGTDRGEAVNATAAGGQRPLSDFVPGITVQAPYDSNELSHRRHRYLEVAVDKLIADLEAVQAEWATGDENNYRASFTTLTNEADAKTKLTEILNGMGTLSEGELAGERMQIAFATNSQEDEHSCFSDNTHRDIWLNAEGVSNSFYGSYAGYDSDLNGTDNVTTNAVDGYGIDDYLTEVGLTSIVAETTAALTITQAGYTAIDESARAGTPFDVLIQTPTETSSVAVTIKALNAQSRLIQDAADQLGLGTVVEGDASGCNTEKPTSADGC
jgi:putative iron-regulated protein